MTKALVMLRNLLSWSPAVEDLGQKRSRSHWKRKGSLEHTQKQSLYYLLGIFVIFFILQVILEPSLHLIFN